MDYFLEDSRGKSNSAPAYVCSIPRTPTLKVLAAQQDLAIFIKRWRPPHGKQIQTPIHSAFGATTGRAAKKMGGLDMLEAFSMRKP
eukprot:scaffold85310_cov37-Phaeocystis_antarctica.AAC.1